MALQLLQVFKELLSTPGPSGYEQLVSRIWRKAAAEFSDQVTVDISGSSLATIEGGRPRVLLHGHIDEIGFMISHIDDQGFLYFLPIGGFDAELLLGQRVKIMCNEASVVKGVVVRKDTEFMTSEEKDDSITMKEMWIDIGAENRKEAEKLAPVGSVGVMDSLLTELPHKRWLSRAMDNRVGTFIILEVLKRLYARRAEATVVGAATTQEEISLYGAKTTTFVVKPDISLVIDVGYATDMPESDKKTYGNIKLGGGPVLSPGAQNNPLLFSMLRKVAEENNIPYSIQITPSYTATDADAVALTREGVATAVVSVPLRYMHSPNEMVQLDDIEKTITLIELFIRSLSETTNVIPR